MGALWNFNFFAEVAGPGGSTLDDYDLVGRYDFDPGVDTDESLLGKLEDTVLLGLGDPVLLEGSENLSFAYLATDAPALGLTSPVYPAFNPYAGGEYSFSISSDVLGGSVAMNVEVAAVPVPAGLLLLISGLGGLGLAKRRRAKA